MAKSSRSLWTGSISFGLVTIPVSLRTAVEDHDLKFSMLDKDDLSPVGYLHVNKRTGKEVAWQDITKGYEYKKGKYVVLGPEDFKKANVKASQILEIEDFVDAAEVDPIYFDRPYYVVPEAQGALAYELLLKTLERSGKIGIGRLVLHTKQHVAAILPMDGVLLLELMRFAHEVRPQKDLELPEKPARKVSDREITMAEQLVSGMTSHWKPEKYKDTYHDDLLRLINLKIKRGATAEIEPYNEPAEEFVDKSGKVLDLMPLLKASLSRGRSGKDVGKDEDTGEDEGEDRGTTGRRSARGRGRDTEITPISRARKARASGTTRSATRGTTKKASARAKPAAKAQSRTHKATRGATARRAR